MMVTRSKQCFIVKVINTHLTTFQFQEQRGGIKSIDDQLKQLEYMTLTDKTDIESKDTHGQDEIEANQTKQSNEHTRIHKADSGITEIVHETQTKSQIERKEVQESLELAEMKLKVSLF